MPTYLDFEAPIAELEGKIAELQTLAAGDKTVQIADEVKALEKKAAKLVSDLYQNLDPWQKALVARHPERPHAVDYIESLFSEFTPMAGDRKFAEDFAVIGGIGRFRGLPVMVLGQEKGNDTTSRLKRNFGMARPEGYRKAVRLMEMADRFGLPLISFVDTAGAYPGIDAEERGQAEAIARSTDCCLMLSVPSVSAIIGEGGSGGAIAIATTNVVLMLEHAIYSVISPEGAASILWRDAARAKDAAAAMKITAQDLKKLGVIDEIVPEPKGGAHRGRQEAIAATGEAIARSLKAYEGVSAEVLRTQRREKFLSIGRGF
jgi:acetyl-CoA carboxylase carboxyl transferase subunit alpha